MRVNRKLYLFILIPMVILLIGMLLPSRMSIPVQGATRHDWNHQTFWNDHWGRSGVHKGIDIFAHVQTPVLSATYGIVVYRGKRLLGGNTVVILGPKWRIHYYAHLKNIKAGLFQPLRPGDVIGSVGRTGNARKKPAHLHYSVMSLLPMPWRWDDSRQGWKKTFFLDPTRMLLPKHRIKLAKKKSPAETGKRLARNAY